MQTAHSPHPSHPQTLTPPLKAQSSLTDSSLTGSSVSASSLSGSSQAAGPASESPPLLRGRITSRKPARPWWVRVGVIVALAGLATALVGAAIGTWMPLRRGSDALTATAIRGSLVITVVERGELDSAKSLQI